MFVLEVQNDGRSDTCIHVRVAQSKATFDYRGGGACEWVIGGGVKGG